MTKMKTRALIDAALDYAVAKCLGQPDEWMADHKRGYINSPSTDWSQAGPIIEREGIEVVRGNDLYFPKGNENGDHYEKLWIAGTQHGQTPLIAAMRCFVASKLGDEVDIPEELQ